MTFEEWFESYTPDRKEREQCADAWHAGRREGRKTALEEAAKAAAPHSLMYTNELDSRGRDIDKAIRSLKEE